MSNNKWEMIGDSQSEIISMSLLVVGSVAFDAVETPFGQRPRMLGGSASHFSIAASFFTDVRLVAVVGGDFGPSEEEVKLSESSKQARMVFLGNIQPDLQRGVREQIPNAELVALDTMNLWIETTRDSLQKTIAVVDLVIINDAEARQLTDEPNLIKAARKILSWGPRSLIVKRGEYGAAMFTKEEYFAIPAYPLEAVFDPTGAGDTFAGGLMGYLASQEKIDEDAMRRAMIFGSVMASFNVEEFGTERVQRLTHDEVNQRFRDFKRFTHFEEIPFERAVRAVR